MSADHVHVSDLRWDRLLAGELTGAAEVEVLAAASGCASCTARHAELRGERDAFARRPPLVARPAARSRWWVAAPALVAAAAVIVLVMWTRPSSENASGERAKGDGPVLLVEAGAPGRMAPIASGDRVAPGDHVQAAYTASRAGFGAVLGRDGSGAASVHVPASGEVMVALPAGTRASFPESTVLDDVAGEERLIVVWCEAARPLAPLVAELRARGDVTDPAGCWHRRLVLTKAVDRR